MSELLHPRGIFSGEKLPKGWTIPQLKLDGYLQQLNTVCPDLKVVSQIARGANSITFVLKGKDGLRVCQFSGPTGKNFNFDNTSFQENHISRKFRDAETRMNYLRDQGFAVPEVFSSGTILIDGDMQEFIVMSFLKGISVDTFVSSHPHKKQQVYERIGALLARLQTVPLGESPFSANEHVLEKVEIARSYLVRNQILTLEQGRQLMSVTDKRVNRSGDFQASYVHLDPTPVNIQVTGSINNYILTLLDVEAINLGHPLIEGLGRALKWGIYDWDYVSGGDQSGVFLTVEAFLRGYSQVLPEAAHYTKDAKSLQSLLETTELTLLPSSIMKEHMKSMPGEYYEWSRNRLSELISIS